MVSSQSISQMSLQPPNIRDHAIQLNADLEALKTYQANSLDKNQISTWLMIKGLMSSMKEYLCKIKNLFIIHKLATEITVTAKAQENIRKDVIQIKNLLTALNSKAAVLIYAQTVQNLSTLKSTNQ